MSASTSDREVTLPLDEAAGQSLARGAAGTALLHVERACTGSGDWHTAHTHIRRVLAGRIDASEHASLFYGAPAVAFLLHAAADHDPRYRTAARTIDEHVLRLTRGRLATARARVRSGRPTNFAEYDLFYGLAGIGALLLRRHPGSGELAEILRYIVTLTRARRDDGDELPGWWVAHNPDEILPTPGGHANLGMAHGAAGLLSFLALAALHGCEVDGQREAITALTRWFDRWQQAGPYGPWWPQWLTRDDLCTGRRPPKPPPGRPSWCYGTVGIARAQQLAAMATGDQQRQQSAEYALAASLADAELDRITEPGLCHGIAGVSQTAYRAAHDADDSALANRLPTLADRLAEHARPCGGEPYGTGLLTGYIGTALALETARRRTPPRTGWDACLLIT